jgi:DNA-binding NarL/FixJ family response regulator
MPIKIHIADDHPIVAEGLRRALADTGIEIVDWSDSPEKLLASLSRQNPDVLVTEIRLAGSDLFKILEPTSTEETGCPILFFAANINPTNLARASTLNCHDYLAKTAQISELISAIQRAAAGEPTPKNSLLKKTRVRLRNTSKWSEVETPLTQREQQVLQHVAMGLSNREVARSLEISVETVKEHVQNIMRKLDANDRTQAAVYAVRQGLI